MKKVALFSALLILGMVGSRILPDLMGDLFDQLRPGVDLLTIIGLAFIMIHVGYEFEIDKSNLRQYGWDFVVAMTAAAFPWIFASLYFVFVMFPPDVWASWPAWLEALLAGKSAAPTSTGVLFAMLAAAGLSATWLFQKARVLAVLDDLDTVLLMILLKTFAVGLAWPSGIVLLILVGLVWMAWRFLHSLRIPVSWPWVLGYSVAIAVACETVYSLSKLVNRVTIHIEVLLPAFVLGCIMMRPRGSDPHSDDSREGHQEGPEDPVEQRVSTIVSAVFMVLVGLSMPLLIDPVAQAGVVPGDSVSVSVSASQPFPGWTMIMVHVVVLTILVNLGKMFPVLCYRREASWKERLGLAISLWPRAEVGAGVLILSLGYGIGGPMVKVAMLCLALNLVLTGAFIWAVKGLLTDP